MENTCRSEMNKLGKSEKDKEELTGGWRDGCARDKFSGKRVERSTHLHWSRIRRRSTSDRNLITCWFFDAATHPQRWVPLNLGATCGFFARGPDSQWPAPTVFGSARGFMQAVRNPSCSRRSMDWRRGRRWSKFTGCKRGYKRWRRAGHENKGELWEGWWWENAGNERTLLWKKPGFYK